MFKIANKMIRFIIIFLGRLKNLKHHYLNIIYNNFTMLNVCSIVFIAFCLYLAFVDFVFEFKQSRNGFLAFLTSFFVSALISSFILNKFKYSKYIIIKVLQKLILYSILTYTIGYLFGINIYCNSSSFSSTASNPDLPIDFIVSSINEETYTPFQEVILSLMTLNTISIWMCLLVIISLVYKFVLPSDLRLEWLNKILPEHFVNRIKSFLNYVISINKKTNSVYIFLIFFVILICNGFALYYMNEIYNNLNLLCIDHLKYKK